MSYFDWFKSLLHVRFGRLEKRFETAAYRRLLRAVEQATDTRFPDDEALSLTSGAAEEDLVNSGLLDTLCNAFHEIRQTWRAHSEGIDLRTAAYICAIDKIVASYSNLGIFP